MMSLSELDTAARLAAPLLVVVFNDAAYGAEVHDFAPLGISVDAAVFPDRDLAAIARAIGCAAVTVRRVADLDAIDGWSADPGGPLVVDAKVDPRADAASLMTPLGAAGWSPAPRPTRGAP
jgi:thiamine pyrophosphate-dependent acetolactate synthase large subunit-like protein